MSASSTIHLNVRDWCHLKVSSLSLSVHCFPLRPSHSSSSPPTLQPSILFSASHIAGALYALLIFSPYNLSTSCRFFITLAGHCIIISTSSCVSATCVLAVNVTRKGSEGWTGSAGSHYGSTQTLSQTLSSVSNTVFCLLFRQCYLFPYYSTTAKLIFLPPPSLASQHYSL